MMAAQIRFQFSYLFNLWTIERFRDERTLRWTNQNHCFPVAENALPFGRLWSGETNAVANAIGLQSITAAHTAH